MQSTSEQSELAKLQEMFPHHAVDDLRDHLLNKGFESAVTSLLDNEEVIASSEPTKDAHLDTLLMMHAGKVIDPARDTYLTITRSDLWQRATCFYKTSKNCPHKLTRNLVVTIDNEEGIDAGAIWVFFIEKLMKEIDNRLFEGEASRRVPKKDSDLCTYLNLLVVWCPIPSCKVVLRSTVSAQSSTAPYVPFHRRSY